MTARTLPVALVLLLLLGGGVVYGLLDARRTSAEKASAALAMARQGSLTGAEPGLVGKVDPDLDCPWLGGGGAHSTTGSKIEGFWSEGEWTLDAVVGEGPQRLLRMIASSGFSGGVFEFALDARGPGEFGVSGSAHSFWDFGPPFEFTLEGLSGTVTLNTLDWREETEIVARFDLSYMFNSEVLPTGDLRDHEGFTTCLRTTPRRAKDDTTTKQVLTGVAAERLVQEYYVDHAWPIEPFQFWAERDPSGPLWLVHVGLSSEPRERISYYVEVDESTGKIRLPPRR